MTLICECEDDNGDVCNRAMSAKEYRQDGICSVCADYIAAWYCNVMNGDGEFKFYHDPSRKRETNRKD